jgi:2'-hydroxyisoflavone reductase
MSADRRDFLKTTAAAGAALTLGVRPATALAAPPASPVRERALAAAGSGRAIRILVLGGTGFIGPWQIRAALAAGHQVTMFNRGRTNPGMFPEVEKLRGDRNGDLQALEGREWDVVIDNATNRVDWVRMTADLLRDSVGLYYFVSSRAAYRDYRQVPMTADYPTWTFAEAGLSPDTPADELPYGLGKAESERAVWEVFPNAGGIFRPGLIVGPGDRTNRFTYWPVRIAQGGEVLAPGDGTDPVQIIDVRDLCEWMIRCAEAGTAGAFTVVGPANPRPMAELLYGIRAVTSAETTFTWVPTDFLLERDILPYREMPVWRPARGDDVGFARFDLSNEVAHGLTFRPLAVTTADTLEWQATRDDPGTFRLSPDREAEVLAAWHASRG